MTRTKGWTRHLGAASLALALLGAAPAAMAAEAVVNGGFETNGGVDTSTFTGWTLVDQSGGSGSFYVQSGTSSPSIFTTTVPAPPQGTYAAMSAQSGPGSHILYQDIAIPAGATATFSARVYVNNSNGTFSTPASLDYGVSPNQQARIDVMNPSAAVTDMGAGVLRNLYRTQVGDPAVSGYTLVTADLSAYAGSTIRLRIAEVDNAGNFLLGVDAVSVDVGSAAPPVEVPTTSEWALVALALMLGAMGIVAARRRGTQR